MIVARSDDREELEKPMKFVLVHGCTLPHRPKFFAFILYLFIHGHSIRGGNHLKFQM